jgi:glycosyltransferase involved in cell wall biosynthesis
MKIKDPIIYIDAINATANYNYCILRLLQESNIPYKFITTEYNWDRELPKIPNTFELFFKYSNKISFILDIKQQYRKLLRGIEYPFNLLHLYVKLVSDKCQLIHFNWIRVPKLENIVIKLLKKKNKKIVLTVHNHLPHGTFRYSKSLMSIYHHADAIVTLSLFVKNRLVEDVNVNPTKIYVLPHINYQYLINDICNINLNGDYSVYNAKKVILFFGSIASYKGLDLLIKSFAKIHAAYPDSILKICGSSKEDFNKYYNMIEDYNFKRGSLVLDIRHLNILESIREIRQADLVVLPYKQSSQSGVIPLVNTLGVPVLATRIGGIPEMIKEGYNGYTVKPNDIDAISDLIIELFNDAEKLKKLRITSHKASTELFSQEIVLDGLQKLYHKLLKS